MAKYIERGLDEGIMPKYLNGRLYSAEWVKRGTKYYTFGDHVGVYEYRLSRDSKTNDAFNRADWDFWERQARNTPIYKDNRT